MEYLCENCNKSFNSEESFRQHNLAKHTNEKPRKVNFKKYFIFTAIALILILLALSVNNYMKMPGQYDDFAKCLTEKEAVVYGNDYCSYTVKQLNFFGKSKEYLTYVKCIDNKKLCDSKSISITPTWEINGESYSGVQSLGALAQISGCN
ncbi:hypothetical protein BMS3Abin17_00957 [archaeon BMS3Abin17]|nr:hypothetical protein BMS3Abin17_00957 [archaeon BMS3Abin17]HDZ60333.1 hypothetical protein [Candidatus Pacearchaeota archaeon]